MNAALFNQPGAPGRSAIRKLVLVAVVAACCAAASAAVQAAETTGRVFGNAPAGSTVTVGSPEFGFERNIPVNADGRYQLGWLPIGIYTVSVARDGQALYEHPSVQVYVDRGSRVDFSCGAGQCSDVAAD